MKSLRSFHFFDCPVLIIIRYLSLVPGSGEESIDVKEISLSSLAIGIISIEMTMGFSQEIGIRPLYSA